MLNLKKTAVAVLALGSSAVFAGSMGPVCSAVNVTVPCEATAWDFGAKALYMKPTVGAQSGFSPVSGVATVDHEPNYHWGFQIEGSYHFNTGNDLNINWYHISKSQDRDFGPTAATTIVSPLATVTTALVGADLDIDPKWDAVNFEFGQHVDFGDNKAIRFHGGAQYSRLTNNVTSSVASNVTVGGVTQLVTQDTTFNPVYNGFGPRVGMDLSYDWGNGLGIYANGATALLAGTRSYSATYSDNLTNDLAFSVSKTAIVPALDAKLGATYTYAMAQGDLTLDAGWMWVNYFNARSTVDSDATGEFGLQGPFIGLKWLGNVA